MRRISTLFENYASFWKKTNKNSPRGSIKCATTRDPEEADAAVDAAVEAKTLEAEMFVTNEEVAAVVVDVVVEEATEVVEEEDMEGVVVDMVEEDMEGVVVAAVIFPTVLGNCSYILLRNYSLKHPVLCRRCELFQYPVNESESVPFLFKNMRSYFIIKINSKI